jgi:predicted esterase
MKLALRRGAALAASVALAGTAFAVDPRPREDLRAILEDYRANGDLEKATTAIKKKGANAKELLVTLREPRRPEAPPVPGVQSVELHDGHGRKTDLKLVAPSAAAIASRAKAGLGLVVLLHGLKGSAEQVLPYAEELAATDEVVVAAPSAQPLPAGIGPEDGCPDMIAKKFPHWWLYESNRSFPLEAIRKARELYPIDPDRVVLCGVSMGGYGTWNIGLRHSDRFAAIAALAGGLTRLSQVGMHDDRSTAILENALSFPIFAAHGDKDGVVPYGPDKEAADKVKELGGDIKFHTLEGVGHDVREAILAGGTLAPELKSFVTTKRRNTLPLKVTYVSLSEKLDGATWLRIATRGQKDHVRVEGAIDRAHNVIHLSGDVELARVYLDDRILDPSRSVTILVGGEPRWKGRIVPDMKAMLESWRSREDERLVYPAYADVDPR